METTKKYKVLFSVLYFSEGAPIGFIWWALPVKMKAAGMQLETITSITALLLLPWIFKFIWAPLIDIFRGNHWSFSSWIVTMQIIMGVTLLPLIFLDFQHELTVVVIILFIHAIAAATQDVAIDGFALSIIPDNERGSVNGWMQFGMLIGRSAFGGVVLMLDKYLMESSSLLALVIVIWTSTFILLILKDRGKTSHIHIQSNRKETLSLFLHKCKFIGRDPVTWYALGFAAFSGAAFESIGAIAGPYLIEHGISEEMVGVFFSVVAVGGLVTGSLIGGYLTDKFGSEKSTSFSLIIIVVTVYTFSLIESLDIKNINTFIIILLGFLYIAIGFFISSSYTLFMKVIRFELRATQFSALMSMTNVCESWSSFAIGKMIPFYNYSFSFFLMGTVSLATLPLIKLLNQPVKKNV